MEQLSKINGIIMLQETWLYSCELNMLNEIHANYTGTGKSVDDINPRSPIQMPSPSGSDVP